MDDDRFSRIAQGLWKAASMTADELAAKKGEDDLFVRIKRNHERLRACSGHDFEPDPGWRQPGQVISNRTVRCRRCGGDMKFGDAHTYLLGVAHGSGQDYKMLCDAIWPPAVSGGAA